MCGLISTFSSPLKWVKKSEGLENDCKQIGHKKYAESLGGCGVGERKACITSTIIVWFNARCSVCAICAISSKICSGTHTICMLLCLLASSFFSSSVSVNMTIHLMCARYMCRGK